MKEIHVNFKNENQKIVGVLHTPNNPTESIVILVHGFTGNKDGPDNIFVKTARKLCENGFAVLRFDFRGSRESEGNFVDMTVAGEVSDLKAAVSFVQGKGYENIGIVGESLGGAVSILAYDKTILCMVLWYPAIYLKETSLNRFLAPEVMRKAEFKGYVTVSKRDGGKYMIGRNFIKEIDSLDVTNKVKKISCPLLIVTGDRDSSVSHHQSERAMHTMNEPKKLEIIKGAEHCFCNVDYTPNESYQQKAVDLTVDWFNKWLK